MSLAYTKPAPSILYRLVSGIHRVIYGITSLLLDFLIGFLQSGVTLIIVVFIAGLFIIMIPFLVVLFITSKTLENWSRERFQVVTPSETNIPVTTDLPKPDPQAMYARELIMRSFNQHN